MVRTIGTGTYVLTYVRTYNVMSQVHSTIWYHGTRVRTRVHHRIDMVMPTNIGMAILYRYQGALKAEISALFI